jgi:hypothetical protein
MALADERRSASAHVLSAADENAQKSKPNVSKTNPRKLSRLAASCAASSLQRASERRELVARALQSGDPEAWNKVDALVDATGQA